MDTSIAIAIALGVLFLVILPGYLSRLESARSRQSLDRLPQSVRAVDVEVSACTLTDEERAAMPLIPRSGARRLSPAVGAGDLLPTLRWPVALGAVEGVAAERERPQLRVVEGEGSLPLEAEQAETVYLDLASGEMYPATHIRATPEERLMNQERPPRAVASASRRPSNARRPLAHVTREGTGTGGGARRGSGAGTSRTSQGRTPSEGRSPSEGRTPATPAPRAGSARPTPSPSQPAARRAPRGTAPQPRYPALGVLFLLLGAATLVGVVLMIAGVVSWAMPVLTAGLALGDLVLIRSLRRGHARDERKQATDAGEHSAQRAPARATSKRATPTGKAPTRTAPPAPEAEHATDVIPALPGTATGSEDAEAATHSRADDAGSDQDRANEDRAADTSGRDTGRPATDPIDSAARRIAGVRSRSWTPKPIPQPTYVAPAERGAADVSLQEALAMEFASEPGRRPEIDDALAHGRNATRPGKGDAAGMAELAREKREAQRQQEAPATNSLGSIDDILQRRRA